jgi:endonuclease G
MKLFTQRKETQKSLLADSAVMEELKEMIEHVDRMELARDITARVRQDAMRAIVGGQEMPPGLDPLAFGEAEAIVQIMGRPVLFIQDDEFEMPTIQVLRERLEPNKNRIIKAIKSVARLELLNHPDYAYIGTAWMVADRIMVTNRHVARAFARRQNNSIVFRTNIFGDLLQPQVDFKEEYQREDAFEVRIESVLYIEEDVEYLPDIAFVQVAAHAKLPEPIYLCSKDVRKGENVAVIGYPARDYRNDAAVMDEIFKGIYKVKRLAPGMISMQKPRHFFFTHDCSTLGGNSGSAVIKVETGEAVGLHFSGKYLENNFAVNSATILSRMRLLSTQVFIPAPAVPSTAEEAAPTHEELGDRTGYDSQFLGVEVPLPRFAPDTKKKIVHVDGSPNGLLNYTHYSVAMHEDRRLAAYVVCNIDGSLSHNIRRGRDKWYYDPRIDRQLQAGNELYKNNPLDRGHLVRRLDPAWGKIRGEARRGNDDTFFWTNCSPQHSDFNQTRWLRLEDYVLENANTKDLKISVFTGPIFRDTDKEYRGFLIPEDYWKIVAMVRSDNGQLSVTGYIVSQRELIDELEFVYGPFRTYQVPVARIEKLTGTDFGDLGDADPLAGQESQPYVVVRSPRDLVL